MTDADKVTLLHERMIALTQAGRLDWARSIEGYMWASPNHSLVVESDSFAIYDRDGRRLFEGEHPLTGALFSAAEKRQEHLAVRLIEALIADLDQMSVGA